MEVMELEEGEACLNKKDLDSTFDPDVAFSYIVSYFIYLIELNLGLISPCVYVLMNFMICVLVVW